MRFWKSKKDEQIKHLSERLHEIGNRLNDAQAKIDALIFACNGSGKYFILKGTESREILEKSGYIIKKEFGYWSGMSLFQKVEDQNK